MKDARPAYLVILEVDDPGLRFVRAHVIQIAEVFLADILRRMRHAQANGIALNKDFHVTKGKWGARSPR